MIIVESTLHAADNAGAILLKCINVRGGFKRRYARLGEFVDSIATVRQVYNKELDKKFLSKKVQKKRKQKSKKIKPYIKPYWALLIGLKNPTNRRDGSYIKFYKNRALTFTEPTKFGPAGKSTNIPNFLGSRIFSPLCQELKDTPKNNKQFSSIFKKIKSIV